jgi:hypothetical protein
MCAEQHHSGAKSNNKLNTTKLGYSVSAYGEVRRRASHYKLVVMSSSDAFDRARHRINKEVRTQSNERVMK